MDIAKIRKKHQEQTKKKDEPGAAEPQESGIRDTEHIAEVARQAPDDVSETPAGKPAVYVQEIEPVAKAEPVKQDINLEELGEDDFVELLTFSLSQEEFAFRVPDVEEIVRFQKITRVPTLPSYVMGITSLRGKIIPVLDLKVRLKISGDHINENYSSSDLAERALSGAEEKILIVSGTNGMIGAVIDKVLGVIRIARHEILDPPAHLTETELKFIEGVVINEKRFISIINSDDTLCVETG